MQPKSRATVVVVFSGTAPIESIRAPSDVISASVVNGGISEMAETAVVLPTPNPPAMTILTGVGGRWLPAMGSANGLESTNDPFEHVDILGKLGCWAPNDDVPELGKVGDQHSRHPDVQLEHRGDLGHRHCVATQLNDVSAFKGEAVLRGHPALTGQDLRLNLQRLVDRLCAAGS